MGQRLPLFAPLSSQSVGVKTYPKVRAHAVVLAAELPGLYFCTIREITP